MKKRIAMLLIMAGVIVGGTCVSAEAQENETWNIWEGKAAVESAVSGYDFSDAFDDGDFQPGMIPYLVEDQSQVKGNIIVCSGGGDRARSNDYEGVPACEYYNSIGYNAFLLNYRVAPYETVDATLDLQRAIRYLKHYGEQQGIGSLDKIATMGFSAGAMHCYAQALAFGGAITPDQIYEDYTCDEVDEENADVAAVMAIYAAGMPHDASGNAIDVKEPVLVPKMAEDGEDQLPAFFFAGASGHFASGFCVKAYEALNDLTTCELHMYGGISKPFGMGYEFAGSDEMTSQIETFLDVQFGYRPLENEVE